jgi:hypothetical protein
MDSEELRLRVEIALRAATARADELVGLAPDTVPHPEPAAAPEPAPQAASPAPATEPAMEHRGT